MTEFSQWHLEPGDRMRLSGRNVWRGKEGGHRQSSHAPSIRVRKRDRGSQHRELRRHTQGTRREPQKGYTVLEAREEVFQQGGVVHQGEGG